MPPRCLLAVCLVVAALAPPPTTLRAQDSGTTPELSSEVAPASGDGWHSVGVDARFTSIPGALVDRLPGVGATRLRVPSSSLFFSGSVGRRYLGVEVGAGRLDQSVVADIGGQSAEVHFDYHFGRVKFLFGGSFPLTRTLRLDLLVGLGIVLPFGETVVDASVTARCRAAGLDCSSEDAEQSLTPPAILPTIDLPRLGLRWRAAEHVEVRVDAAFHGLSASAGLGAALAF